MSKWEDEANHHAAELVKLTMTAANQGAEPLPEDEVARLGKTIATERQLLIDSMSLVLTTMTQKPRQAPVSRSSMRVSCMDWRSLELWTTRRWRSIACSAASPEARQGKSASSPVKDSRVAVGRRTTAESAGSQILCKSVSPPDSSRLCWTSNRTPSPDSAGFERAVQVLLEVHEFIHCPGRHRAGTALQARDTESTRHARIGSASHRTRHAVRLSSGRQLFDVRTRARPRHGKPSSRIAIRLRRRRSGHQRRVADRREAPG